MADYVIDEASANLMLELQREDVERDVTMTADRKMAASIARACYTDGETVTAAQAEEQHVVGGGEQRLLLEGGGDDLIDKFKGLYMEEYEAEDGGRPCVACREHLPNYRLAKVPCNHEYCRECLQELFRSSITDDTLFPPRCCRQPITIDTSVRLDLTPELIERYEAKKIEVDTRDRTYCSSQACSAFIQAQFIEGDVATCPTCETKTCTLCKAAVHEGDCPADTVLQEVLQLATQNGWQRCSNCRRVVELDTGCNHITCPCGTEFCYVCGDRWKSCECPQWQEDRLLARANVIVGRQPNQDNPVRRAAVVEALRERHNCRHRRWRLIEGPHMCENCLEQMPNFIRECRQCHIRSCERCKQNRL